MRSFLISLFISFLSVILLWSCRSQVMRSEQMLSMPKPNILFIAVDDLRPELNCYGKAQIISPHIDQLAAESLIFNRAYCQVPVCGASRASLLTGLRPTPERFVDYATRVDQDAPEVLTLPQHLKEHGYYTISNGKVFHHLDDMTGSWSEDPWHPNESSSNWRDYVLEENIALATQNEGENGPSYEMAEVEDDAYFDGKIAQKTIDDLKKLAKKNQPFFLATGFLKPHLPFNAPTKYWNLYDEQAIKLAANPFKPKNVPDEAIHHWGELRNYTDISADGPLPAEKAKNLIHGYYACISYTDAQIGKVLQALEELDLADNTIIVLWGDHGWNLQEHSLWCKHANFETSLRAPLMIKVPEIRRGHTTQALTEFVDIYPSLCELAGIPVPHHLEGTSFVPLLTQPDLEWKKHAISKFHDGYSIKSNDYRYTEWTDTQGNLYARMLYDHRVDSLENNNISEKPENQSIIQQMQQVLYATYPRGIR